MANQAKKSDVKRILGALKRSSQKNITLAKLSRLVGLYPDVLCDILVNFDPMIRFDPSINIRNFAPAMEEYVKEDEVQKEKSPKPKRVVVTKKELSDYSSIADFVYKKMTSIGGLVETSMQLSDQDLHILQKLVNTEVSKRKRGQRKKAKRK